MSTERSGGRGLPIDEVLDSAAAAIGHAAPTVGPDERALLLDLARVVAHRGDRTAAPITAYMAGAALGALEPGVRIARLRDILAALEHD